MSKIIHGFEMVKRKDITQEEVRNYIRNKLINDGFEDLYGLHLPGIIISKLIEMILDTHTPIIEYKSYCDICGVSVKSCSILHLRSISDISNIPYSLFQSHSDFLSLL